MFWWNCPFKTESNQENQNCVCMHVSSPGKLWRTRHTLNERCYLWTSFHTVVSLSVCTLHSATNPARPPSLSRSLCRTCPWGKKRKESPVCVLEIWCFQKARHLKWLTEKKVTWFKPRCRDQFGSNAAWGFKFLFACVQVKHKGTWENVCVCFGNLFIFIMIMYVWNVSVIKPPIFKGFFPQKNYNESLIF